MEPRKLGLLISLSVVIMFAMAACRVPEPKPESTEGRPWGQPLKKAEGAPLNLG